MHTEGDDLILDLLAAPHGSSAVAGACNHARSALALRRASFFAGDATPPAFALAGDDAASPGAGAVSFASAPGPAGPWARRPSRRLPVASP